MMPDPAPLTRMAHPPRLLSHARALHRTLGMLKIQGQRRHADTTGADRVSTGIDCSGTRVRRALHARLQINVSGLGTVSTAP
jgi:hypothetical protein